MKRLTSFRLAGVLAALLFAPAMPAPAFAQGTHVVVVVGLAGDPEHGELFRRWAGTLVDHAAGPLGIAKDRIVYLLDQPEQDQRATGRSSKETIDKTLGSLASSAGEDDVVLVVLIGHGSFDGKIAKFNLRGPDMTPADFGVLLKRFTSRKVVFVNTASASGPFIEALAGPGRTIVTATRTGAEKYATLFGGAFIDALAGGEKADADKNRRVSILEAFNAARIDVARAYEQQGIMITEHALLEDGGDGEGSLDPAPDGKDGRVASILALGTSTAAQVLPADPKLRQLYEERSSLERRVEGLKLLKGSMDPPKYAADLEKVLTDLALKTQQIRAIEGKK
ncbi:MAG: hypothetical protein ABIS06_20030 [Vicinamibacterales bacterium]